MDRDSGAAAEAGRHDGDAPGHPGAGACTRATARPVGRSSVASGRAEALPYQQGRERPTGVGARAAMKQPPVDAAGAVDAKSTRPPLLGKPQNGFPQRPQGITQGTFLFR